MSENLDTEVFEVFLKDISGSLSVILCDNNAADKKTYASEKTDKADNLLVVGDVKVTAELLLLDCLCAYGDNNFRLILKLKEHFQFTVGLEAGQYPCGVVVVKKLTAEFKLELTSELRQSFSDVLRLCSDIFVVVKTNSHFSSLAILSKKLRRIIYHKKLYFSTENISFL